jgi:ribonuclease HI
MGVVFVDVHGRVVRRIGRTAPNTATHDLASFRGIVYALWNSRRPGSRRVVVHSDHPSVVAQINGHRDVDPALVGPYLEARPLLHAYRRARVEVQRTPWGREAEAAAEAAPARDTDDVIEDLPLWAGRPLDAPLTFR